jgi:hypothetical protein
MERLQRIFSSVGGGAGAAGPQGDTPQVDTSEQVYISSLALLKMLKHGARLAGATRLSRAARLSQRPKTQTPFALCPGRAGVPMEVMGLMLGEFVDDYTVKVVDVFAMPQARATAARSVWTRAVAVNSLRCAASRPLRLPPARPQRSAVSVALHAALSYAAVRLARCSVACPRLGLLFALRSRCGLVRAERHGRVCGGCGSGVPDQDAGHAEADGPP